jgi:hypothetical protein
MVGASAIDSATPRTPDVEGAVDALAQLRQGDRQFGDNARKLASAHKCHLRHRIGRALMVDGPALHHGHKIA